MNNLFVQFDRETETVTAGPQGHRPDDSWVPYIPAENIEFRQATKTHWIEELQTVVQVPGDKHVPDYAEQRRLAYPKLAEQLDKLFHDIDNGTLDKTGGFYQTIKGVKDDIPKPGG